MKRLSCLLLLVFSVCFVTGCPQQTNKAPKMAKVSGTVKMDGQPMGGGEVRFSVTGQPPKSLEVKDGAFSGEVYVGKNLVEVVWDVDGGPHPMNPNEKLKVNKIAEKFWGPSSALSEEVPEAGKSDLKYEVTSAKK